MTRYILIDNHSGYVMADTADLDGAARDETPAQAAYRFERSIGVGREGRAYEEVGRHALASNESGYHVYRGSEAVPVVTDGQDQVAIEAVERDGDYVTTLRCVGDYA